MSAWREGAGPAADAAGAKLTGPLKVQGEAAVGSCRGELADVVAYLEQRRDNAAAMAKRCPEHEPFAADRRRQLDVIIEELRHGRHCGSAAVRADLGVGSEGRD